MDNLFITQYFDWDPPASRAVRFVNAFLRRIGITSRLTSPFQGYMTSIEQRINLFHLLNQVLIGGVPGDIVEVGTHKGTTAVLFAKVISEVAPERSLHAFDAFLEHTEKDVLANFDQLGLPAPIFHRGWLDETLLNQAPEQIAFFQIDLGSGRSPDTLAFDVHHALAALYPRMSPGAVGVLQDYWDPAAYDRPGYHLPATILSTRLLAPYPQVKKACDDFFRDKPERVDPLYGGSYSHGYFRKQ